MVSSIFYISSSMSTCIYFKKHSLKIIFLNVFVCLYKYMYNLDVLCVQVDIKVEYYKSRAQAY